MLNFWDAIHGLDIHSKSKNLELNCVVIVDVRMKIRGCGTFGIDSTPKRKEAFLSGCDNESSWTWYTWHIFHTNK
jgi:hypothetical protein